MNKEQAYLNAVAAYDAEASHSNYWTLLHATQALDTRIDPTPTDRFNHAYSEYVKNPSGATKTRYIDARNILDKTSNKGA